MRFDKKSVKKAWKELLKSMMEKVEIWNKAKGRDERWSILIFYLRQVRTDFERQSLRNILMLKCKTRYDLIWKLWFSLLFPCLERFGNFLQWNAEAQRSSYNYRWKSLYCPLGILLSLDIKMKYVNFMRHISFLSNLIATNSWCGHFYVFPWGGEGPFLFCHNKEHGTRSERSSASARQ